MSNKRTPTLVSLLSRADSAPETVPADEIAATKPAPARQQRATTYGHKSKKVAFSMYLDPDVHEHIDDLLRTRRRDTSPYTGRKFKLHDWILEAIDEKLERMGEPSLLKIRSSQSD